MPKKKLFDFICQSLIKLKITEDLMCLFQKLQGISHHVHRLQVVAKLLASPHPRELYSKPFLLPIRGTPPTSWLQPLGKDLKFLLLYYEEGFSFQSSQARLPAYLC